MLEVLHGAFYRGYIKIKECWARGDISIGKVFALQAQRPEFDPQIPQKKDGPVICTCNPSIGMGLGTKFRIMDVVLCLAYCLNSAVAKPTIKYRQLSWFSTGRKLKLPVNTSTILFYLFLFFNRFCTVTRDSHMTMWESKSEVTERLR